MHREYGYWHSSALRRTMEYLIFGSGGIPFLIFPTSMGRFYQYEDFSMVQTLASRIESGRIQLFCVDSVDAESWYNKSIPPAQRAERHRQYERYILEEFILFLRGRNAGGLTVSGCSFGAYHAANFAFKHPEQFCRAISISGSYDLKSLADGYYDDGFYFNSPIDFLPNLQDSRYLDPLRRMSLVLLSGDENDITYWSTLRLSNILRNKGIDHTLDIWRGAVHDWPVWKEMALKHF
ncbi:MAG TPA: alpha/beta hydrolase-fold protein [Acidobacteriota bacterium]|nr:alpha/beta hydrolase-fold protein [Acidobacteriota bacterium]